MHKELQTAVKIPLRQIKQVDQADEQWDVAIRDLATLLKEQYKDALSQLILKGPVEDGDITSKSKRDDLIEMGLANKIAHRGEFGFSAATYVGLYVFKAMFDNNVQYHYYLQSKRR